MRYLIEDSQEYIYVRTSRGDDFAKLFVGDDDHPLMMEAAEILKAFFEAKSKGVSARLVCGEMIPGIVGGVIDHQRPKNTVIGQMNDDAKAVSEHNANAIFEAYQKNMAEQIWGNRANNMTLEQYEVFTIAHNAAVIFAHNMHNTDERRAVASAAKILGYAQEGV